MTTKEQILQYVQDMKIKRGNHPDDNPIFQLLLFEKPDAELIFDYPDGTKKPSGYPDTGCTADMGFYYDIDHAIDAMNKNTCDIRETCYNAGFILCRFQGLYTSCETDTRMYFRWDNEKQGFFQQEEPIIFSSMAF